MINKDIKLAMRYVVLGCAMYMAWFVIQPGYAVSIKDIGEVPIAAIYASVFGCVTLLINKSMATKVDE